MLLAVTEAAESRLNFDCRLVGGNFRLHFLLPTATFVTVLVDVRLRVQILGFRPGGLGGAVGKVQRALPGLIEVQRGHHQRDCWRRQDCPVESADHSASNVAGKARKCEDVKVGHRSDRLQKVLEDDRVLDMHRVAHYRKISAVSDSLAERIGKRPLTATQNLEQANEDLDITDQFGN